MKKALTFSFCACLLSPFAAVPAMAFEKMPEQPAATDANSGSSVPEPAGYALLGLGIGLYIGAVQMRKRRRDEGEDR